MPRGDGSGLEPLCTSQRAVMASGKQGLQYLALEQR